MKIVVEQELKGIRAVVLGAGVAGLSAAVALAARGARVRVLERGAAPGGRHAVTDVDGLPVTLADPVVTQPAVFGQLFAMANQRLSDFLELQPLEPILRLALPDGATFAVPGSLEALAAEVAHAAPEEGARLRKQAVRWQRLARAAGDIVFSEPGEGIAALARLAGRPAGWPLLAGAFAPRSRAWQAYPKSPLAAAFDGLAMSWGATATGAAPGFRAALLGGLLQGAWVPAPGTPGVIEALVRLCALADIRIVTGARVERLNVEDGVVRHVAGEGFKTLRADLVVSTLGVAETVETLVPECEARTRFLRRQRRRLPSRSALLMVLRCRRRWQALDDAPRLLLVPDDRREMDRQIDRWAVPAAVPPVLVTNLGALGALGVADGQTLLRVEAPMPPVSERFRWSAETVAAERERLLKRLEQAGAPGLADSIDAQTVLSPADIAARLGGGDGSLWGPSAHRLNGWLCRPPQECAPFRGLYFAGIDCHPGPTLPAQVLSGMLAAEKAAGRRPSATMSAD